MLAEEEARADGLKRLEEETAKHFKRVSGHIIQQLDILGTAINVSLLNFAKGMIIWTNLKEDFDCYNLLTVKCTYKMYRQAEGAEH